MDCIGLFQKLHVTVTTNLQEFLFLHARGCHFVLIVLAHQTTFSTQPEKDFKKQ